MTTPLIFSVFLDDLEYAIEGDYSEGSPGITTGPWENAEEPEPSEFEITSIKLDGLEFGEHEFPADLLEQLQNACNQGAEKAIEILREKDQEDLAEEAAYWRDS